MHAVDEAVTLLVAAGRKLAEKREKIGVPVHRARGLILADDVVSTLDVPPRDNSAMDGYAYRYKDAAEAGFRLKVSQRVPAGKAAEPLEKGTAARIFTGAEIPDGADTVAMQEDCRVEGCAVVLAAEMARGANIRRKGQDVRVGDVILRRGVRLRPQELGLLASVGCSEAVVSRPLRIAMFSTGDELVDAGKALQRGQIYNSNRATLAGLFSAWNMDAVDLGICPDKPEAVAAFLAKAAQDADVVVTSGGVSVGEEDHVKDAVEKSGSLNLWKIAIKPGKPLAFGEVEGKPFIGLPGNPASVFVTALILLRPFLLAMAGQQGFHAPPLKQLAQFSRKAGKRQEYLRARRVAAGVEIFANQSSGMLSSACWGDGFVVQYAGQEISEGQAVDFFPYDWLF